MPKIGLKYMVCAPITETGSGAGATVEYTAGMVMSRAISAEVSVDVADAKLFADDMVSESMKSFTGGTLNMNGDDFSYAVQVLILGHTLETLTTPDAGEMLIAKGSDDGKPVGVGFYSPVVRKGLQKFRALWLSKVKFGEPSESNETKGEDINFQTPTIEGTIMQDVTGVWKKEAIFDTETAAISWLNALANIT